MTLPTVTLTGTAYQQGLQHGRALHRQIIHNLDVYFDRFWREGGVARGEVLQRAARYGEAIAGQNVDYVAGMEGIAIGAGVRFDEIVALNVRYEILYYQYMVNQLAAVDGCTAFALAPDATANGHLWLGQNWDWIPEVRGALLRTRHEDGLETLAFTEAGIFGGKIGMNSAGLGLAINGMTTTGDDWTRLEKPFHLRCYEILRQTTIAGATAVITGSPRACSANFLIAQTPDQVIDLEAAPDDVNALQWQEGCLVHANHFVDPAALGVAEPPSDTMIFSCYRQERLQEILRTQQPVTMQTVQEALRNHVNAPRSICRHEDPAAPIDEQYRTVTSVIMDLHEGVMLISDGPPCANDYTQQQLSLQGET